MTFWINTRQPEKFCVTSGNTAMMITHKSDEFKVIHKRLDAGHAANIKARYSPGNIEKYPIINSIIKIITN